MVIRVHKSTIMPNFPFNTSKNINIPHLNNWLSIMLKKQFLIFCISPHQTQHAFLGVLLGRERVVAVQQPLSAKQVYVVQVVEPPRGPRVEGDDLVVPSRLRAYWSEDVEENRASFVVFFVQGQAVYSVLEAYAPRSSDRVATCRWQSFKEVTLGNCFSCT